MEQYLQAKLNDYVAGRVLLRQAGLTEFQRELLALKDLSPLLTFEQVSSLLRPLDRPDMIAQAANAALGSQAAKHDPGMREEEFPDEEEEYEEEDKAEDEEEQLDDDEPDGQDGPWRASWVWFVSPFWRTLRSSKPLRFCPYRTWKPYKGLLSTWAEAKHFLMCDVEDDQAADQSACCHDFDGVFDQVNAVQSIGGMSANEMFKRMIARAAVWIANSARRPPRTRDHVKPSSSCWEDGGCESGGCSVGEQEVERPKAHRGLEEAHAGGDPNSDDREAADGRGSHRDEGQPRDQRGRGRGPIRFDKQAQQERWPNGTGHRQPDEEVSGPSQVPGGCGTMPTSSRRTSVQGKSAGEVVDMHSLRGPMVPAGRSSSILCNNGLPGDSSGRSPEDPKQPSGIPELFATAQGEAGAGTTRGRDGTEHSVHILISGTEGGHYEGKDSDDFGGIAANPTGQNANRCEPPARDLRDQLGRRLEGRRNAQPQRPRGPTRILISGMIFSGANRNKPGS